MFDVGIKQVCPLSPALFRLYIDELEPYLDMIDMGSSCVFNIMIAILLYANDVVLLSKLGASLQRLLEMLYN